LCSKKCCSRIQLEVVKFLVENGANIHAKNDHALKLAAANGHFEIVKYLIVKGANFHALNDQALRYAQKNKQYKIVRYLKTCQSKIQYKRIYY